ncbi:MAG: metal-dependent hydrolase [Clostridiales bacterium]|nr:metal-dependent hydrolase [Clostridiales bacterium]
MDCLAITKQNDDHSPNSFSESGGILYVFGPLSQTTGCLSHLLLDCLNKKPVRLLYPIKTGFCMRLCYADGAANKVLLWVGVLLTFCGFVLSWMIALLL